MKKRFSLRFYSLMITLLFVAFTTSAVYAAKPLAVHIEVEDIIGGSGETFFASGAAVDAGLVCPTGTEDDISVVVSGSGNSGTAILHILKRFTCADSTGTFDVQMVVKLDNITGMTTAHWKFVNGSGAYTSLKGHGSLVGTPTIPGQIYDVYDGFAH